MMTNQNNTTQMMTELAVNRIQTSIQVKTKMLSNVQSIVSVADVIVKAFHNNGKVLLFGNGGSAADAQHIAGELVGTFYIRDRHGLPALSLATDSSSLTAISNDSSYENVFARQIEALGKAGDVSIGISTSGKSANVLRALAVSKEMKITTVSLTGSMNGKIGKITDYCINIQSHETPRIQEDHILVGHILCEIVEKKMFG